MTCFMNTDVQKTWVSSEFLCKIINPTLMAHSTFSCTYLIMKLKKHINPENAQNKMRWLNAVRLNLEHVTNYVQFEGKELGAGDIQEGSWNLLPLYSLFTAWEEKISGSLLFRVGFKTLYWHEEWFLFLNRLWIFQCWKRNLRTK